MTRDEMLREAVRILVEAAAPRRIILFGSQARGDAKAASDLDFVVIEREVKNRRAEIVRLLGALEPTGIPADVLVASESFFEEWSRVPGNVLHEARREGKVVYEAA